MSAGRVLFLVGVVRLQWRARNVISNPANDERPASCAEIERPGSGRDTSGETKSEAFPDLKASRVRAQLIACNFLSNDCESGRFAARLIR
jgi:hypothetical protein